jgi:hypothetical protein
VRLPFLKKKKGHLHSDLVVVNLLFFNLKQAFFFSIFNRLGFAGGGMIWSLRSSLGFLSEVHKYRV